MRNAMQTINFVTESNTFETENLNSEIIKTVECIMPVTEDSEENIFESDFNPKDSIFCNKIKMWGLRNNITHKALNELLHILREKDENLPKDIRTLSGTPKTY